MTIKIKIGSPSPAPAQEEKEPQATMSMKIRKTLTGEIIITDHLHIDIIVAPKEQKVLALSKGSMSDTVYDCQDRLFDFLLRKGVIVKDSIQGGNIYASMEAKFPISESSDSAEVVVFTIGKFLEEERPYFAWDAAYTQQEQDRLLKPDQEDSTELGEVPAEDFKGSIPKSGYRRMAFSYVYEGEEKE